MQPAGEGRGQLAVQRGGADEDGEGELAGMLCEASTMAIEKEKTMPTLAKVRNIPDEMPKSWGGDAFITAEVLAGRTSWRPGR